MISDGESDIITGDNNSNTDRVHNETENYESINQAYILYKIVPIE